MENHTASSTTSCDSYENLIALLQEVMEDEEEMKEILAIPTDNMSANQRAVLRKISQHFAPDHEDDHAEPLRKKCRVESSQRRSQSSGNHGPKTGSPSPWKRFLNLNTLTLDPNIQQYLQTNGTNPSNFLSDTRVLHHPWHHTDNSPTSNLGDTFIASYKYTRAINSRASQDLLRWQFAMMLQFDLVKIIRPDGSGQVGHIIHSELMAFLQPLEGTAGFECDVALEELKAWSLLGSKLAQLRDTFGAGCFFYLPKVTEDFLKTKFTRRGMHQQEAFQHLKSLNLQAEAESSGAAELGQNICDALIAPFVEARQRQTLSEVSRTA